MTRRISVIGTRDRRRAGIKFKKDQKTPVELPEDDDEAEALIETLMADPMLRVLPEIEEIEDTEDAEDADPGEPGGEEAAGEDKAKPSGRGRKKAAGGAE